MHCTCREDKNKETVRNQRKPTDRSSKLTPSAYEAEARAIRSPSPFLGKTRPSILKIQFAIPTDLPDAE